MVINSFSGARQVLPPDFHRATADKKIVGRIPHAAAISW
jgi:hypothetical protein